MPDLQLGSYKFTLASQFEPGWRIAATPMRHPNYGPIPGMVACSANYRIKVEQVDKSHGSPIWMPSSSWEIGFYQVIESAECRRYRKKFATRPAERLRYSSCTRGILGVGVADARLLQFQKTRIHLGKPHLDTAPDSDNKPWYGKGPLGFSRWDFPQLAQHERVARLEVSLVPAVISKVDPLIFGLKQEQMILSTYLIFMDRQRRYGWTLRQWRWSAHFAYYKDPVTGKEEFTGPGIALMEEKKQITVNQRGLPEDSPTDTVLATQAFQDLLESVVPAQVNNAYVDMGLDLPWR